MAIDAPFPEKMRVLFEPWRYKVLYGGRGASRSWSCARALLLTGTKKPIRVLCAREYQNSISESVHKLLVDQIAALGLEAFYDVQVAYIKGKNGTTFAFEGIKNNTNKIKSYEGIDYCWVEEANKVSKASWGVLIPTIRKDGSEIWMTFNPELDTDYTYQRFVVTADIKTTAVVKMTWKDNPFFPDVLRKEMEDLRARDYDQYLNVWEGHCLQMLEGTVYAKELRRAQEDGRITKVPYDRTVPVDTFWDLGRADNTAIWFAQRVAMQNRILAYYEASGEEITHFLRELQSRAYVYGTAFLPHDARAKRLGSKRTIEEIVRQSGHTVSIVPRLSLTDGINAARIIFPGCWFDETECADGLHSLRHYRYKVVEGQLSNEPLHDAASDGCFAPETVVLTRYGERQIKDLPETGEVLTPCGWKQYVEPRVTRTAAQLVAVTFSDGLSVRCTPDHLFLTASGWKSAKSLAMGTLIRSSLTQSLNTLTGAFTAGGQPSPIYQDMVDRCIGWLGDALSVMFPTDATSIIEMATRSTMSSPIWNAYQPRNTYRSVGETPWPAIQTGSPNSLQRLATLLRRGTHQNLGAYGIPAMRLESSHGQSGNEHRAIAHIAGKRLTPSSENPDTRRNTAPNTAKWLTIESVSALSATSDVWDITVPDGHCFALANGATVHNSDAFRYLAVSLRAPRDKGGVGERLAKMTRDAKALIVGRGERPSGGAGWLG